MAMFHGKPREAEVTSLRDAVARLERSRQRAEELARERAERAAEMQQEIVRLQAENQRLAARVRGEAFALEHNESMVDRIVEENRQLRADKERLLLEISRVGRDNQRLLKEARRPDPYEVRGHFKPEMQDLPGSVADDDVKLRSTSRASVVRFGVQEEAVEHTLLSSVPSAASPSLDGQPLPYNMRGIRDSQPRMTSAFLKGTKVSAEYGSGTSHMNNSQANTAAKGVKQYEPARGQEALHASTSGSESTGSAYYLNWETGVFDRDRQHIGTIDSRYPGTDTSLSPPAFSEGPGTSNGSDTSAPSTSSLSHKRCRTHPGHPEAERGRKLVDQHPVRQEVGGRKIRGRMATESLPPEYFKSRGIGVQDGELDALSLFTPQVTQRHRRLSTPLFSTLEQVAREPTLQERENIIEAFFVIDAHEGQQEAHRGHPPAKPGGSRRKTRLASLVPGLERNRSRTCWPDEMQGSELERLLVERGFCPGPMDYRFSGNAFVFSLQATAVDPKAHPDDPVPFCVVCSEDLKMSALPADHRKFLGEMDEEEEEVTRQDDCDDMMQHIPDGGVLCLVSKIPFFDFSFTLLDLLRRNLSKAPAILERINRAGMAKLARGVEVSDILGSPRVLGLNKMTQRMPRELLSKGCNWSQLGNLSRHESSSPLAHTLARWQGWWGLLTLLMRWGDRLLEEVVMKLLPAVLLEQQVVLFGDAQRTCVVAFLLRGMLWPFRWQHLFVSSPWPTEELQNVPLMEAPFPFIFAFGEITMLQHFWGYENMYDLPDNIVACLLRDRWVVINEKLKTSGGLTGKTLKFPPFIHSELRSQIKEARSAVRNRHGFLDIVQKVQGAVEAAMGKLANIVKRYARSQVEAEAATSKDVDDLYVKSCKRAENEERFLNWLRREPAFGSVEQAAFYKSFYQTQCFMDCLYEEIHSQAYSFVLQND